MAWYNVDSGYWETGYRYPFLWYEKIGRAIVRDSNGDMFFCYCLNLGLGGDDNAVLRKSTDNGVTWGSQETIDTDDAWTTCMTIDSNDNIFAAYAPASGGSYVKKRNAGGSWSSAVEIGSGTRVIIGIHVDSNDYIYVIILEGTAGNPHYIRLYKSTDGGSSFSLKSTPFSGSGYNSDAALAIDNNDDLHLAWSGMPTPYYKKSTDGGTSWGSAENLGTGDWTYDISIIVDSNNVPHVLVDYGNAVEIWYNNRLGGSWGAAQQLADGLAISPHQWEIFPTLSIDRNGILYAMYCSGVDEEKIGMRYSSDGGHNWSAKVNIFSGDEYWELIYYPTSMNAVWPKIGGVSTNIMASGWNCGHWYTIFFDSPELDPTYIKYGSGIITIEEDYAFVA